MEDEFFEFAWQDFLLSQVARTPLDGVVVSVLPFGAFVRLHDGGVDGLLHRSEWTSEPEVGDTVSVRILDLDLDRRRIALTPA
jgi:small subunit ribosomal protein S1